jgi:NitT/TauT family transport system substrate-binding protein
LAQLTSLLLAATTLFIPTSSLAAERQLQTIRISSPGPLNLSFLPVDLAPILGFDKEEGVKLKVTYTVGGGLALTELAQKNVDFTAAGLPVAMSAKKNTDIATVMTLNNTPLFILMVRSDLKNKIKSLKDLKGKTIGVNTSSLQTKTTSLQLFEILLKSAGLSLSDVKIVPAGQDWKMQSSLIYSKSADALMGDEPYATKLLNEKKVFFLESLAEKKTLDKASGLNFIHGALHTRKDILEGNPQSIEKVIAIFKKTIAWINRSSPNEIVSKLGISDPIEKENWLIVLNKYANRFSINGSFSKTKLQESLIFFRQSENPKFEYNSMIVDKWVGTEE